MHDSELMEGHINYMWLKSSNYASKNANLAMLQIAKVENFETLSESQVKELSFYFQAEILMCLISSIMHKLISKGIILNEIEMKEYLRLIMQLSIQTFRRLFHSEDKVKAILHNAQDYFNSSEESQMAAFLANHLLGYYHLFPRLNLGKSEKEEMRKVFDGIERESLNAADFLGKADLNTIVKKSDELSKSMA